MDCVWLILSKSDRIECVCESKEYAEAFLEEMKRNASYGSIKYREGFHIECFVVLK